MGFTREINKAEYIGLMLDLVDPGKRYSYCALERHPLMKYKKETLKRAFTLLKYAEAAASLGDLIEEVYADDGMKQTGRERSYICYDMADYLQEQVEALVGKFWEDKRGDKEV